MIIGWVGMASAAVLQVDGGGAAAFTTIQSAIDVAIDGDVIEVAAGVYSECLTLGSKDLEVVGAGIDQTFLRAEAPCAVGYDLRQGGSLVLDGVTVGGTASIAFDVGPGGALQLRGADFEGPLTLPLPAQMVQLDDATFVARDCTLDGDAGFGRRPLLKSVGASTVQIERCTIRSYEGGSVGGALDVQGGGHVLVRDSELSDNEAQTGGGIFVSGSTLDSARNVYRSLRYQRSGGAIAAIASSMVTSTDDTFEDIQFPWRSTSCGNIGLHFGCFGGAIYADSSDVVVQRGTFARLGSDGGGAVAVFGGTARVTGSAFADTSGRFRGGGALRFEDSDVEVRASLFTDVFGQSGGAVQVTSAPTSAILEDLAITNADATFFGGAIELAGEPAAGSTVEVRRVDVVDSDAERGGAIYVSHDSPVVLSDITVRGATAQTFGGAIGLQDSPDVTMERLFIQGTSAGADGGAIWIFTQQTGTILRDSFLCGTQAARGGALGMWTTGPVEIVNTVLLDNSATLRGGALWSNGTPNLSLLDTTIVGAGAPLGGAAHLSSTTGLIENTIVAHTRQDTGVHAADAATAAGLVIGYSAFHANALSDVSGGLTMTDGVDGNVLADPMFVAWLDNGLCDDDDLGLAPGSLLVDAGNPARLDDDGTISDIGADGAISTPPVDLDGDGFSNFVDCDDAVDTVFPGAAEVPYDGIDQDCDGSDLLDADGDGEPAIVGGGTDCDDMEPTTFPGAPEVPYDGVDQDCDGSDLVDVDGDGEPAVVAGGMDCDDAEPTVFPGALEVPYDTVDQDCDGADLVDVDGDGEAAVVAGGADCDDTVASVFPGAVEVPYDTIDQDCDGFDLVDVDQDGEPAVVAGGADCDDTRVTVFPGAIEIAYDGIDQDCDGADLVDVDGDGDAAVVAGGTDCDDAEPTIYLGASEIPYDTIDQDCDGFDLVDVDGDGDPAIVAGGADCDDGDPSVFDGASEEPYDGIDQDCDGVDLIDVDGDGDPAIVAGGSDCDDADGAVQGLDADGDGVSLCNDDCDDADPARWPGADDLPDDGVDQDCDGVDATSMSPETPERRPEPAPMQAGCGCETQGSPSGMVLFVLAAMAALRTRARVRT